MTPLPPKQGLKQGKLAHFIIPRLEVMTPLPPKQGLKQHFTNYYIEMFSVVMTPLPPKQGLKPPIFFQSGVPFGRL